MRKNIVAGNWKMNKNATETITLINDLKQQSFSSETTVLIAPPFVNLSTAVEQTSGTSIGVVAQNMHQSDNGAYTGEISAEMLKDIDVNHVILGHSERRAYFGEDDQLLSLKVKQALKNNLSVVFCFGEELEQRKSESHFEVVKSQIQHVLFDVAASDWRKIILAYEPVWAIGTGETASPMQAQEMHAYIRSLIKESYGADVAHRVSILYGGSVKPSNAKEIFSNPDVDGGLIGGASLVADDFAAIINAF